MKKELGNVSTAFQQVQLYGNLSYIKEGTDEESTVKEKLRVAVENLENYMNEMEELCAQTNDSAFQAELDAWKTQTLAGNAETMLRFVDEKALPLSVLRKRQFLSVG